ncbi:MAG: cupin domain-containing protein [Paracoccaceae bacterium]
MIDMSPFLALADIDLGPLEPKPTSFEGNQREAAKALFTSPDGRTEIGVWECTPGRFRANRSESSEFCHFINGMVELKLNDGTNVQFGPGDAFNLPLGWTGEWRVIEHVRKLYISVKG